MRKLSFKHLFALFLIVIAALSSASAITIGCANMNSNKSADDDTDNTRDYKYEHYCDSIFVTNPDYYLDVLVETDKYQEYVKKHGEWWAE